MARGRDVQMVYTCVARRAVEREDRLRTVLARDRPIASDVVANTDRCGSAVIVDRLAAAAILRASIGQSSDSVRRAAGWWKLQPPSGTASPRISPRAAAARLAGLAR